MSPMHRDSLNNRLIDIQSLSDAKFREMLSLEEAPTQEEVKKMIRSVVRPTTQERNDLLGFVELFIIEKNLSEPRKPSKHIKIHRRI
ncbi:MAG: hypothetical protein J7L96_10200 [Bacteroidales bacterium]|nr:hypothetical protein [Bacteroidales bacterium]